MSIPFFSVIVPIQSSKRYLASLTLDSIASQVFSSFEVLIIKGQVDDKKIFNSFSVYECPEAKDNLSLLMNKGLELARGKYVHFLLPGEFYLSRHAFSFMRDFIEKKEEPDLVYTGFFVHYSLSPSQIVLKQMTKEDLKGGRFCPSLQAYWFRKEALLPFNPRYEIQGGFEMLCRFYLNPSVKRVWMKRVLTDYQYQKLHINKIFKQFWEVFVVILVHFGISAPFFRWLGRNYLRLWQGCLRQLKAAFWKKDEAY